MPGFFYNLGRRVGPGVRKGAWLWQSLTGSEDDAVRAEQRVGRDLLDAVQSIVSVRAAEDERLERLQSVGQQLAGRLRNKTRRFSFQLLEEGEPNAFALPGGYIMMTAPLYDLLSGNQDETAFVLGHEIGHVVLGHALDRLMASTAASLFSRAAPVPGALRNWVRTTGLRVFNSAYSQNHELDADAFGARLARAAGFDPEGSSGALHRLRESSPPSGLFSFLGTHPPIEERIRHIRRTLREA